MNKEEFEFKKFKKGGSILPVFLTGIVVILVSLLLRNCNSPNKFWSGSTPTYAVQNPSFPERPNILRPIDTTKIIVPNDPLKRPIISNLVNVYVQDTVDLKKFTSNVINAYIADSLKVTYYGEEYKRVQFEVPPAERKRIQRQIKNDFKTVKFVCDESIISQSQSNNDPGFSKEEYNWFYKQIGLYKAWNITQGKPEIKIAVIDNSFDLKHKELINQIEKPWNVVAYSEKMNTFGKFSHGTHVAGTVAGEINNNFGISGVAPKCKLIPIQISDSNGMMTTSSILDGIFYALKNDADVINMSLGLNLSHLARNKSESEQENLAEIVKKDEAEMWKEVCEIAIKEGTIIVQAAGNSHVVASLDPMKRSEATIVVGAVDKEQNIANFSNYGKSVDIYAPGVGIYSSVLNQKFEKKDGTSMACPITAGCIALMKSVKKDITIGEIKTILQETAIDIGNNRKLIQIDKALSKLNKPTL